MKNRSKKKSARKSSRRPIAIDLFAGAGGLSLGFESAGFDVVAAVEYDPVHAAVHEYNFPSTRVYCADITDPGKVSGERLLADLGLKRGDVDTVFGGPPCQGFSLIGKRLADDPRNACISHFQRLVSEIRPKYFVMENVAGMTVGPARTILDAFIEECKVDGYRVVEPIQVLNAAEFGVPQDRRRVFVYGYLPGCDRPEYPQPTTLMRDKAGKPAAKGLFDSDLVLCPSVTDAIADLPDIDSFDELIDSDSVPFKLKGGSRYAKTLRGEIADEGDHSYPREFPKNVLTSSMRADHGPVSRKRFSQTKPGEVEPISRFLKLPPLGVCNTLRAGTATDHGAFTSPRPIHPQHPRCISVREAARLHSYPDWFRMHVTKWHGFRQIGNSVPPLLGRAVAKSVITALGVIPSYPKGIHSLENDYKLTYDMAKAASHFDVSRHVIKPRLRLQK